jgi:hypothetical protein
MGRFHYHSLLPETNRLADPFTVTAALKTSDSPQSGEILTYTINNTNQTATPITDNNDGTYSFTVTPTRTGEFPVTVSYNGSLGQISTSKTPLVLQDIADGWGQPMSVEGLVNTAGYEDGVTITQDGSIYLCRQGRSILAVFSFSICQERREGLERTDSHHLNLNIHGLTLQSVHIQRLSGRVFLTRVLGEHSFCTTRYPGVLVKMLRLILRSPPCSTGLKAAGWIVYRTILYGIPRFTGRLDWSFWIKF